MTAANLKETGPGPRAPRRAFFSVVGLTAAAAAIPAIVLAPAAVWVAYSAYRPCQPQGTCSPAALAAADIASTVGTGAGAFAGALVVLAMAGLILGGNLIYAAVGNTAEKQRPARSRRSRESTATLAELLAGPTGTRGTGGVGDAGEEEGLSGTSGQTRTMGKPSAPADRVTGARFAVGDPVVLVRTLDGLAPGERMTVTAVLLDCDGGTQRAEGYVVRPAAGGPERLVCPWEISIGQPPSHTRSLDL